jgi:hypothetical protein
LERAPPFSDIVERIVAAADSAFKAGPSAYYWQPEQHSHCKQFERAVFQFPVGADLFDWFWNARTGFRAQFWLNPNTGTRANARMAECVASVLPAGERLGPDGWPLFDPIISKCWFAEDIRKLEQHVLIDYFRTASSLTVTRWGEVRALRPNDGETGWLEIMGQFSSSIWALITPAPDKRARLMHRDGFL